MTNAETHPRIKAFRANQEGWLIWPKFSREFRYFPPLYLAHCPFYLLRQKRTGKLLRITTAICAERRQRGSPTVLAFSCPSCDTWLLWAPPLQLLPWPLWGGLLLFKVTLFPTRISGIYLLAPAEWDQKPHRRHGKAGLRDSDHMLQTERKRNTASSGATTDALRWPLCPRAWARSTASSGDLYRCAGRVLHAGLLSHLGA